MSLNKVMLICRLGSEPEKKITQSGLSVVSFSAATSEKYKDKSGNKKESTEWHKIVLWNRLAELADQYLTKGSMIYLEGALKTKEWKDKDGNTRYTTEIIGQTVQFLDSQSSRGKANNSGDNQGSQTNQQNNNKRSQVNQNYQHKSQIDEDFIDDDIPF